MVRFLKYLPLVILSLALVGLTACTEEQAPDTSAEELAAVQQELEDTKAMLAEAEANAGAMMEGPAAAWKPSSSGAASFAPAATTYRVMATWMTPATTSGSTSICAVRWPPRPSAIPTPSKSA